jgi:hypothetical protein
MQNATAPAKSIVTILTIVTQSWPKVVGSNPANGWQCRTSFFFPAGGSVDKSVLARQLPPPTQQGDYPGQWAIPNARIYLSVWSKVYIKYGV